ncbi:dTMP kinase [Candidatus Pacearchaeota archaeon]|nr:dTMP kinase [Candidatus Pacearchaeota archaeon]
MEQKRGKYILFEGIDNSGKSTQAKLLHEHLTQVNVPSILVRQPDGTELGKEIRKIVLDSKRDISSSEAELFLFLAARAELFKRKIIPNLENGTWVVGDRGHFSSEAYQGHGRGISINIIKHLNDIATYSVKPDLAFILDISFEKGIELKNEKDRIESLGNTFHEKVRNGFLKIFQENRDFCELIERGNKTIEQIHEEIKNHLRRRFWNL